MAKDKAEDRFKQTIDQIEVTRVPQENKDRIKQINEQYAKDKDNDKGK